MMPLLVGTHRSLTVDEKERCRCKPTLADGPVGGGGGNKISCNVGRQQYPNNRGVEGGRRFNSIIIFWQARDRMEKKAPRSERENGEGERMVLFYFAFLRI